MQRIPGKLGRHLSQMRIQQMSLAVVGLLVIGGVSYVGTQNRRDSMAATLGTMYVAPAAGTYEPGSTFSVAIREESGTNAVNSVQTKLGYNAAQLQFVGITEGAAFPFATATDTATPGIVRIARGVPVGAAGVTGDQVIANVSFKVLATTGTTSLTIDNGFSLIVRSSDQTNMMTASIGSTYSIRYPAPTISTVAPTSGPIAGGTAITINGTNFRPGASVVVGGVLATNIAVVSPTQITALTGPHAAGAVSVMVANSDDQQATKTAAFSYNGPSPTISAVTPATGDATGGTTVTITGTNFVSGATVRFGNNLASTVTVVSATQITATAPGLTAGGAVNVAVTNPDGQSVVRNAGYTYLSPAPTVSSLSQSIGFATGGASLTVTGTNFRSGAVVTFDGVPATSVVVVSSTAITLRTPAHAVGAVPVVVKNADNQSATLANAFTYRLAGDANGDGRVNGIDYSVLSEKDGQNFATADFNGDGIVGAADLAILLARWTW
jgi:hypothetical protein